MLLALTVSFNAIWIPSIISAFFFFIAIFGDYSGLAGSWLDFGPVVRFFYIALGVVTWLTYFSVMYFVG
jgi:hypothetical protein